MSRALTKKQAGIILPEQTIQTPPPIKQRPEINFAWSPQLIAYTLQVGGNTYPWPANQPVTGAPAQPNIHRTAALQELTFEADVRVPEGTFITEYEWDFGDGEKGFGETVTHTYTTPSPSTRTRLCVTDNHGLRYCLGKPMNLYAADMTVVGGFALVSPPLSADLTLGSPVVEDVDTSGLTAGMTVFGDGVPEGATILTIDDTDTFTMDDDATATVTDADLWFGPAA